MNLIDTVRRWERPSMFNGLDAWVVKPHANKVFTALVATTHQNQNELTAAVLLQYLFLR